MKKTKFYIKSLLFISLIITSSFSCGDDDANNQEEEDVFAGCCSEETVFGPNVDNLDQSQGEILVYNLFTPNGDGFNDKFSIENIDLYENHIVSIYNSDDEVIFQSNNYVGFGNLFPNGVQTEQGLADYPDGTYKYKIVIENEETFTKSGTFCLFGNFSGLDEQNFSGCTYSSPADPIITGN